MSEHQSLLAELESHWVSQPDKPDETPERTLRALWFAAAGSPRGLARVQEPLPALDDAARARLHELVARRISGIPLAHLTGRQSFAGLELLAGPGALIPRRETETLVRAAVEPLREIARRQGRAQVIDLCTGAGNVALALAHAVPEATVVGADLSEEAVALARRNAAHLGLEARVTFRQGDLFAPVDEPRFLGQVDLLTCNPPYISSAKVPQMAAEIAGHEPSLAFDGGPFGVNILMKLIAQAPRFLVPGGWLCFEVGLGQGDGVRARLERHGGYTGITTIPDEHGDVRAIVARTQSPGQ